MAQISRLWPSWAAPRNECALLQEKMGRGTFLTMRVHTQQKRILYWTSS